MKTWLANNKVISPNVPCLSLFTVLFDYVVVFFACFVVRDLCRSGCRQNFANFYLTPPPPLPPPSPFPFGYFLRPYPQFSVTSDSYLKSVRAWSWFGAVEQFTFRCCSPWETFPREHHVKLWDGTKLTRFAESASSSIVLYMYSRFILLNGSNTLIRAETWDRYDIIPFSKVTTKSLASATGS